MSENTFLVTGYMAAIDVLACMEVNFIAILHTWSKSGWALNSNNDIAFLDASACWWMAHGITL